MDKEKLEELYKIYMETHEPKLFSKFMFNRRMNSRSVQNVVEKLGTVIRSVQEYSRIDESDVQTIYVRLCETVSPSELKEIFSDDDAKRKNELEDSESKKARNAKALDKLRECAGITDNISIKDLGADNLATILMQPKGRIAKLFEMYKEDIVDMHLRTGDPVSIWCTSIDDIEDHHTVESFFDAINSSDMSRGYRELRRVAAEEFRVLLELYSIDTLENNQEDVRKELKIGLDKQLKSHRYNEKNFFEEYREDFREIADYLNEESLDIIKNASEYEKNARGLADSGRFSGEALESLLEMADTFSNLVITDEESAKRAIEYLKAEAMGHEDGHEGSLGAPPIGDRLSEYVFNYEALYREDIVENVTEIDPQKSQTITISNINNPEETATIEGVLIDSLEAFGSPLVHFFNNSREVKDIGIAIYAGYKIIETEIRKGHKTKEELKGLIDNVIRTVRGTGFDSRDVENDDFMKSGAYKKMLALADEKDRAMLEDSVRDYAENVKNDAKIDQLFTIEKDIYDEIMEISNNPDITTVFRNSKDTHISTQILRQRNMKDLQSIRRGSTAIVFDKNGIDPEAIVLSSTINLESNNGEISRFDDTNPKTRSSSLETLKNESGLGVMTNRTNSELVLNREACKPSALMYFGSRSISGAECQSLIDAMKTAEEAGLQFVFVDMDSLEKEMQERENSRSRVKTHENNRESR